MLMDESLTDFNPKGDHVIFPVSYFQNMLYKRYVDVIKAMGYPNVRGEVVYC